MSSSNSNSSRAGKTGKQLRFAAAASNRARPPPPLRTTTTTATTTTTTTTSIRGERNRLPKAIDVVSLASARCREISEMYRDVTSLAGNRRTFQQLPHYMRRRAMSHNIRRLPRRCQASAMREEIKMAQGQAAQRETGASAGIEGRPKKNRRFRRHPISLSRLWAQRPASSSWLETHIWHSKRMHMALRWGYKIAIHPTEKGQRAAYRAAKNHCILHDASYLGCIELKAESREAIVSLICPMERFQNGGHNGGQGVGSAAFERGDREGAIVLYSLTEGGLCGSALGPVRFLWRAMGSPSLQGDNETKCIANHATLWLWAHPSFFIDLLVQLEYAAACILERDGTNVHVLSLQRQLLRFQLSGIRAHSVLVKTFRLASVDTPAAFAWKQLNYLGDAAALPTRAVLAFNVWDPRLFFPVAHLEPLTARTDSAGVAASPDALSRVRNWSPSLAYSSLWDDAMRRQSAASMPSERTLNNRRLQRFSNGQGPLLESRRFGGPLEVSEVDVSVPILLIQRPATAEGGHVNGTSGGGWDIILPAGWGKAFWRSLVFSGARVGGQREVRLHNAEAGRPSFPEDFPDTAAYANEVLVEASRLRTAHFALPPAKRPNYSKIGISTPFEPCWSAVVAPSVGTLFVVRDRQALRALNELWIKKGHRGDVKKSQRRAVPSVILEAEKRIRKERGMVHVKSETASTTIVTTDVVSRFRLAAGVVCLRIVMVGRGRPLGNAVVFAPSTSDIQSFVSSSGDGWSGVEEPLHKQFTRRHIRQQVKRSVATGPGTASVPVTLKQRLEIAELANVTASRRTIGFVTTGGFSLAEGCGAAIATCGVVMLNDVASQCFAGGCTRPFVLVRNRHSQQYRAAHWSLVLEHAY